MHLQAAVGLLVLAAVGFLDALYFTLVTYRRIPPDPRWLPPVCRMDEATCARIVDTRWARLFGVPNSVLGLGFYAVVAVAAVATLLLGMPPFCLGLVALALAAVGTSVVLAWSLLFVLRTPCVLCFLGHGVNLSIALLLVAVCF